MWFLIAALKKYVNDCKVGCQIFCCRTDKVIFLRLTQSSKTWTLFQKAYSRRPEIFIIQTGTLESERGHY